MWVDFVRLGWVLPWCYCLVSAIAVPEHVAAEKNPTMPRLQVVARGEGPAVVRVWWPLGWVAPMDLFVATGIPAQQWHVLAEGLQPSVPGEPTSYPAGPLPSFGWLVAAHAELDRDHDRLSDAREQLLHRTDPAHEDTDGDGLPDGWEVEHGLAPRDGTDAVGDLDADGSTHIQEFLERTDPTHPDRTPPVLFVHRPAGQLRWCP